jgi:hypothetical protein
MRSSAQLARKRRQAKCRARRALAPAPSNRTALSASEHDQTPARVLITAPTLPAGRARALFVSSRPVVEGPDNLTIKSLIPGQLTDRTTPRLRCRRGSAV